MVRDKAAAQSQISQEVFRPAKPDLPKPGTIQQPGPPAARSNDRGRILRPTLQPSRCRDTGA